MKAWYQEESNDYVDKTISQNDQWLSLSLLINTKINCQDYTQQCCFFLPRLSNHQLYFHLRFYHGDSLIWFLFSFFFPNTITMLNLSGTREVLLMRKRKVTPNWGHITNPTPMKKIYKKNPTENHQTSTNHACTQKT